MPTNHQVRLAERPAGMPGPETWEHTEEETREPGEGEVLVQVLLLSLDPAMRGWINEARSYMPPVKIGAVMRAGGLGRVVASGDDRFAVGDYVAGTVGAQEYALLKGDHLVKVDPAIAPLTTHVGALGMTGMTAYFGLLEVGALKEGDTVVVSGAAGAVGSVAGQIAKVKGARVIGIAGGPEKCAWVRDELGFDAVIDYKSESVGRALHEHAPDGIDVYFDNVGGDILDAALANLAMHARVVICGAISQYNEEGGMRGPRNYMALLVTRSRMEGFLVFDYADRYAQAGAELAGWIADGKVIAREEVVDGGLDAFGDTLLKLFAGENTGKLVLRVADE
jgi:NADPH-dependent curcumin reductase